MNGRRFLYSIRLENILSYGPDSSSFKLEPLNVLVGPNASGKSNLIEALSLLHAAPRDLQSPFHETGGVHEWLWKGTQYPPTATIEVLVEYPEVAFGGPVVMPARPSPLKYWLSFSEVRARFDLRDEEAHTPVWWPESQVTPCHYSYRGGYPAIKVHVDTEDNDFENDDNEQRPKEERQSLPRTIDGRYEDLAEQGLVRVEDVRHDQSILSQRRDPRSYPELTHLAKQFERIRLYREFQLGHNARPRQPQPADLPQDFLAEDASNLAVVLSDLLDRPRTKETILMHLQDFCPTVRDIVSVVRGGLVQVSLHERDLHETVPATRMSDGTLRYLCLLAVLCHPEPPPIVCIEEPEMGLHPDVIPGLAKLLVEASERSQIVVTTHSDVLVDALSETPEAVVICERVDGATQLRRLDADDLQVWLEKYRLGELWTRGQLGGNLW